MTKIEFPKPVRMPFPPEAIKTRRDVLESGRPMDDDPFDIRKLVAKYGEDIFIEIDIDYEGYEGYEGYDNDQIITSEVYCVKTEINAEYTTALAQYEIDLARYHDYEYEVSECYRLEEEREEQEALLKEREQYERLKAKFEGEG